MLALKKVYPLSFLRKPNQAPPFERFALPACGRRGPGVRGAGPAGTRSTGTRPAPHGLLGAGRAAEPGRPFVCSWSLTARPPPLPRPAAAVASDTPPFPTNRFLFPLPLTVCCLFDVLKQERAGEQRHEQHHRRPQHCGPGPQRRAGRRRRRRRRHRGNPGD